MPSLPYIPNTLLLFVAPELPPPYPIAIASRCRGTRRCSTELPQGHLQYQTCSPKRHNDEDAVQVCDDGTLMVQASRNVASRDVYIRGLSTHVGLRTFLCAYIPFGIFAGKCLDVRGSASTQGNEVKCNEKPFACTSPKVHAFAHAWHHLRSTVGCMEKPLVSGATWSVPERHAYFVCGCGAPLQATARQVFVQSPSCCEMHPSSLLTRNF